MIIAVDLLPQIECLYNVNKLTPYSHMDMEEMDIKIKSQVIHGARTIRVLQGDLVFTGILSGFIGRYTKHHMDIGKIKSDLLWSEEESPYQIKILDLESEKETILKKKTKQVDEKIIEKLEQKIKRKMQPSQTLLIEGRNFGGIDLSIYSRLIEKGKCYNLKSVITTDDKALLDEVLKQAPYGLMFSKAQLEKLNIKNGHIEEIVEQLRGYLDQGVRYIGVDLENQGGLMLSKSKFCYIEPEIDEQSQWLSESSAAFLGAMTIGIERQYEQERIGKLCVASSFASQTSQKNANYNKNTIDRLLNKVKVRELSKKSVKER